MVDWCAGQREADLTHTIRENYDRLAKEYAHCHELQHKPFDREVLTRFADHTKNRGTGWSRVDRPSRRAYIFARRSNGHE